jgi:hypothetical protein
MLSSMWKRISVTDYGLLGKKIVDWTLNPGNRPRTIAEFEQQLTGALTVVDKTKTTKVNFIDTPLDTILIRLPPREILQQARDTYSNASLTVDQYDFPPYYEVDKAKMSEAGTTPADLFYSSVGDYTTSECA